MIKTLLAFVCLMAAGCEPQGDRTIGDYLGRNSCTCPPRPGATLLTYKVKVPWQGELVELNEIIEHPDRPGVYWVEYVSPDGEIVKCFAGSAGAYMGGHEGVTVRKWINGEDQRASEPVTLVNVPASIVHCEIVEWSADPAWIQKRSAFIDRPPCRAYEHKWGFDR